MKTIINKHKSYIIISSTAICFIIIVCLLFCHFKTNNDVIRLSVSKGTTYYFVLKSDGRIQIEVGMCKQEKNEKGAYDLKNGLTFEKAEKLGYIYIYEEYSPGPEAVTELIKLAEETCLYATNDEQLVTDAISATLWYNRRQVRIHSHKNLPTDMKKLIDLFVALSPLELTLPVSGT